MTDSTVQYDAYRTRNNWQVHTWLKHRYDHLPLLKLCTDPDDDEHDRSGKGDVVIMRSPWNNENGYYDNGHVHIYREIDGQWEQQGQKTSLEMNIMMRMV